MQRPARADIERQAICRLPIILCEILFNVIARANLALLEIDLKCIDLAEEEAGNGVPAVGYTLLISTRVGEPKRTRRVGRGYGVEFIPAVIEPDLQGVPASCPGRGVNHLPNRGLILRKRARGWAELLKAREGE